MRNSTLSLVLPAVLLGLSFSPCAMALQEDGRAPAETASGASTQSFAYRSSDSDGRSIELRIDNGRVVTAKVDGRPIPADRVRKVRDGYDLLAEDGSLIKHVAVAQSESRQQSGGRGGSSASSSSGSSSSSSGGRARSESRASGDARGNARAEAGSSGGASGAQDGRRGEARSRARIAVGPDARGIEIRDGEAIEVEGFPADMQWGTTEAPKSMIGAGLGSPDEALAHHLKIDRAKSTMITSILEGLPAQAAGLEQYDVIVSVNGDRNASGENLRRVLRDAEPGSRIALEFVRGAETRKVEITAVAFDGETLSALEPLGVEGFAIPPIGAMGGETGEGGVMFFVGPDGERREFRMPGLPAMPGGFDPAQMEAFNQRMEMFNRRMEDWARRMEQRMREEGAAGDVETDVEIRRSPGEPRDEARNPRPRDGAGDERMRRLEERLDQLMRELERQRAENRDRKPDA
jgi:hypothetical protein